MNITTKTTSAPKLARNQTQAQTHPVRFELTNPSVRKVCLAGSLNDRRPEATEMVPMGGGKWVKDLTLPPGTYEYRFVVDGCWMTDTQSTRTVPNPFGELNSLLIVPLQPPPHQPQSRASA